MKFKYAFRGVKFLKSVTRPSYPQFFSEMLQIRKVLHKLSKLFLALHKGDFKNNASISLINVYRLSKVDLLLKLILRYVINVFLASCQVSSL